MSDYTSMISAAKDGKLSDFDTHFKSAMADKVSELIADKRSEMASSIRIDGEIDLQGNDDE